jgi:hypothetical protein
MPNMLRCIPGVSDAFVGAAEAAATQMSTVINIIKSLDTKWAQVVTGRAERRGPKPNWLSFGLRKTHNWNTSNNVLLSSIVLFTSAQLVTFPFNFRRVTLLKMKTQLE